MPVISKEQAVERMTRQLEQFAPDELLEVYNELFQKDRRSSAEINGNLAPLVQRLVGYINGDQPIDEIMDLLHLIFPGRYGNVWYDEEDDRIHYDEADTARVE